MLAREASGVWDSGLNQNIAYLVQLLHQVPGIGKVFLLNGGDVERLPAGLGFEALNAPLVRPHEVTHDIDLVIELGATLPAEWLRHVRALGARIVTLFVGHTYADQAETSMFGRQGGAPFMGTPWHEIWTLPHHMKTSAPMLRTIGRVPVFAVPHIWSPLFLDALVAKQVEAGHHFGFDPRRQRQEPGWRVAIFEPNVSVVKNCFIPMLACDQAYRQRRDSVSLMMVMNTFFMKEHPTFNRLAAHLDLTRDSKATYEPRLAFAECMAAHHMDAVVAHQWECGLNYAYYDALYGGYPLIHNSEFLLADGIGLYYPGFEAIRGGQVLVEAWSRDADFWDDYRRKSADFLARRAPTHPANVRAYAQRIEALMGEHLVQA